MTDDRDLDLARELEALGAPDHRPGFWADLRAELSDSTDLGPAPDADLVEIRHLPDTTDPGPGGGADVVEIAGRRPGRRLGGRLLAAAAVVLVAVVTAGALLTTGDGGDDADVATDPSLTEDPTTSTTTTEAQGALRPDGEPVERGVGRPLAVDPTGRFLYVAAPAPGGGLGCEGAPAEALYVERVDGDGSDRTLAVDPELVDATGMPLVALSGTGEIALVPRCEGFGGGVVTGTVGSDGTVVDPTVLVISDFDLGREVDGITDLEFLSPGMLVASTYSVAGDGTEHRQLVAFPVSPSEPTDLGHDGAVAVEVTGDGRLVVLTAAGELLVDGDVRAEGVEPGAQLVVADATIALVSAHATDVIPLDGSAGEARRLPVGGWDAQLVDGSSLLVAQVEEDRPVVVSLDLSVGDQQRLATAGTGQFVVTPDARILFVAGRGGPSGGDAAAPPALLEQRLRR